MNDDLDCLHISLRGMYVVMRGGEVLSIDDFYDPAGCECNELWRASSLLAGVMQSHAVLVTLDRRKMTVH